VDKQNDEARKAARRVERERKRLEMGSEFNESSEDHKDLQEPDSDDQSSYGDESHVEEPLGEIDKEEKEVDQKSSAKMTKTFVKSTTLG
jgi:hypothetical protein